MDWLYTRTPRNFVRHFLPSGQKKLFLSASTYAWGSWGKVKFNMHNKKGDSKFITNKTLPTRIKCWIFPSKKHWFPTKDPPPHQAVQDCSCWVFSFMRSLNYPFNSCFFPSHTIIMVFDNVWKKCFVQVRTRHCGIFNLCIWYICIEFMTQSHCFPTEQSKIMSLL